MSEHGFAGNIFKEKTISQKIAVLVRTRNSASAKGAFPG
jgi:hypothetical protein